ncbi:hypothetical protein J0A71_11g22770 [Encephalitozoon cuniculi]|nr:hypothetical protein J0A71_05g10090 [Encephalitozoon cuniculi]UYI28366.1 hypothetical protein J0A71_11g22770 [Encephalitozoon cuniculi]
MISTKLTRGHGMIGMSIRALIRVSVRAVCCGEGVAEKVLWRRCCGEGVAEKVLWRRCCGEGGGGGMKKEGGR